MKPNQLVILPPKTKDFSADPEPLVIWRSQLAEETKGSAWQLERAGRWHKASRICKSFFEEPHVCAEGALCNWIHAIIEQDAWCPKRAKQAPLSHSLADFLAPARKPTTQKKKLALNSASALLSQKPAVMMKMKTDAPVVSGRTRKLTAFPFDDRDDCDFSVSGSDAGDSGSDETDGGDYWELTTKLLFNEEVDALSGHLLHSADSRSGGGEVTPRESFSTTSLRGEISSIATSSQRELQSQTPPPPRELPCVILDSMDSKVGGSVPSSSDEQGAVTSFDRPERSSSVEPQRQRRMNYFPSQSLPTEATWPSPVLPMVTFPSWPKPSPSKQSEKDPLVQQRQTSSSSLRFGAAFSQRTKLSVTATATAAGVTMVEEVAEGMVGAVVGGAFGCVQGKAEEAPSLLNAKLAPSTEGRAGDFPAEEVKSTEPQERLVEIGHLSRLATKVEQNHFDENSSEEGSESDNDWDGPSKSFGTFSACRQHKQVSASMIPLERSTTQTPGEDDGNDAVDDLVKKIVDETIEEENFSKDPSRRAPIGSFSHPIPMQRPQPNIRLLVSCLLGSQPQPQPQAQPKRQQCAQMWLAIPQQGSLGPALQVAPAWPAFRSQAEALTLEQRQQVQRWGWQWSQLENQQEYTTVQRPQLPLLQLERLEEFLVRLQQQAPPLPLQQRQQQPLRHPEESCAAVAFRKLYGVAHPPYV